MSSMILPNGAEGHFNTNNGFPTGEPPATLEEMYDFLDRIDGPSGDAAIESLQRLAIGHEVEIDQLTVQ